MPVSEKDFGYQAPGVVQLGITRHIIKEDQQTEQFAFPRSFVAALDFLVNAFMLVHDLTQLWFVKRVKQTLVQLICPIVVLFYKIFPHLP